MHCLRCSRMLRPLGGTYDSLPVIEGKPLSAHDFRSAIARSKLFLQLASAVPAGSRTDFEAFLEASIVFGRAAVHRLQSKYHKRAGWDAWWDHLLKEPSVNFFRKERDWILKEGPSKLG